MTDYSPAISTALATWRDGAILIGDALSSKEGSDWTDARAAYDAALASIGIPPDNVSFTRTHLAKLPTLVATPQDHQLGRAILYFHGGGYGIGAAAAYQGLVGHLAQQARAQVLVPDYRLAPQHPFPAALIDAEAAYAALLDNGFANTSLGFAGDSAGDAGLPLPAAGVAISPWADLTHSGRAMYDIERRDPLVSREFLERLAHAFASETAPNHPDLSPVHADLHDLAPILIQVGEREVMLSDSLRLAERLAEARVRVSLDVWPGMFHVWPLLAGRLPEADQAIASAAAFLTTAFTRS